MSYVLLQQLIDRFGQTQLVRLTDRGAVATGMIDTAVIDRVLADTDAVIDAAVSVRYDLVSVKVDVPPLLTDIAGAIAIWKLHRADTTEKVKADYAEAMRQLREISHGSLRLPIAAGSEPQGTGGTGAQVTDRDRPLTADTMTGYI